MQLDGANVALLQAEVYHMLQAVRKFGSGIRLFGDENALAATTQAFAELRRKLRQPRGLESEPLVIEACLRPFVMLFRSVQVNGHIIAAGFGSAARLLRGGFFERFESHDALGGFRQLVIAVVRCRFEATDTQMDEAALQRLMDVVLLAVRHPLGRKLGDQDICTLVEVLFTLCAQSRFSEPLRRQAELAAVDLCSFILDHLSELAERKREESSISGNATPKIAYPGSRLDEPEPLPPVLAALEAELAAANLNSVDKTSEGGNSVKTAESAVHVMPEDIPIKEALQESQAALPPPSSLPEDVPPYGMAALLEILSFLLYLLDVNEKRNNDRMRCLSLQIFADFVDRHDQAILKVNPIWNLISTKLTKFIVQLFLLESQALMSNLQQITLVVFGRFRRRLCAQFELLLHVLVQSLLAKPTPGKPPRTAVPKDFYLDILAYFCIDPYFVVDLYVMYECNLNFGNALHELLNGLGQFSLVDPKQIVVQDPSYLLSLEMLLTVLRLLNHFSPPSAADSALTIIDPEELVETRKLKQLSLESAKVFNRDFKEGFEFIREHKMIADPPTPREIARYLRRTPGLDKRVLGEILSKPANIDILKEFLADFRFEGLEIDEALRLVLESFRLPGESQQISRIMEVFAQLYYQAVQSRNIFRSQDAVFILAYSIVMLNTDQHNRQVRHRMTAEDFVRNNRGINEGANFEMAFLRRIYAAIKEKEIVMPEEQAGDAAFNYTWNEQLKKQHQSISTHDHSISLPHYPFHPYSRDICQLVWNSTLRYLSNMILNPRSETASQMVVKGFYEAGDLASCYLERSHMDQLCGIIAECLAFSEISSTPSGNQLARYLTRSELFKALTRCLFEQFRRHGNRIDEGWRWFVFHVLHLAQAGILSLSLFETAEMRHQRRRSVDSQRSSSDRNEVGLLSTLSQYLVSSPSDSPSAENELRSKAAEFIRTCHIDEIISDSRFLEESALLSLLSAMLEQVKFQGSASSSPSPSASPSPLWETETTIFLVELMVHAAWHNRDRMLVFWSRMFGVFAELAREHAVAAKVREHAILGLGRLCLRFADQPDMQVQVVQFLQLLCLVAPDSFRQIAEPALSIVLRIVELDPPILRGTTIWPHYFTILSLAGRVKSCGPYTFGLLTILVQESRLLFPLEFYSEYIDLLNGFIASSMNMIPPTSSPLSASGDIVPSPVELAIQALNKFTLIDCNVRRILQEGRVGTEGAWRDLIVPVHCAVAQQCYHPVREIRQQALSLLQKIVLAMDFGMLGLECLHDEFRTVLFPLLEELQRPEMRVIESGLPSVEEIQVRAAVVVSRIFLTNMTLLLGEEERKESLKGNAYGEKLWITLLEHMLKFLEGKSDVIRESIPETIKNMLLVMAASKILRAPTPGEHLGLWERTWQLLDPVMPRAKAEIFEIASPATSMRVGMPSRSPSPSRFLDQGECLALKSPTVIIAPTRHQPSPMQRTSMDSGSVEGGASPMLPTSRPSTPRRASADAATGTRDL